MQSDAKPALRAKTRISGERTKFDTLPMPLTHSKIMRLKVNFNPGSLKTFKEDEMLPKVANRHDRY